MNPFAEIEVTPLYSRDGMKSQGNSVRIANPEDRTGWEEIGVVSSNYLLVHNAKIKELVDTIAEKSKVGDWKERKLFFDGRRFVYSVTSDNITAEVTPGDLLRFGLIAYNSYDGSRALSVGAYAEHPVCSNGMTSETYFTRNVFRHHMGNINWDEETEKAFLAIMPNSREKLTRFATTLFRLKRTTVTIGSLKEIRQEYLQELSVGIWGKVIDQFLKRQQHHAFGLLDACTNVFWHNEKQAASDFRNTSLSTDALVEYAHKTRS